MIHVWKWLRMHAITTTLGLEMYSFHRREVYSLPFFAASVWLRVLKPGSVGRISIRVNGSLQPRKLACNLKMSDWNRNIISYPNNPFGGFQLSFSMRRSQDRLCPELLWLSQWPKQNPKQKVFSRHESSQGRHKCDLTKGINMDKHLTLNMDEL